MLDLRLRSATGSVTGPSQDFVINILKICPSLITFRYFAPFQSDIFQYLPPRLEEIGTQIIVTSARTIWSHIPDTALLDLHPAID
ncbi:hypothetical protein AX16_008948 [Volvariella volvacea WC 439]|nr:hypothetical protein AX16_008948 [Volvariella volvacea WC 439]